MLNYVNNAYDKVLKPCDAQQFQILTQSEQTERLIALHRSGDARAKAKLPALTYMGVLDNDKYRKYLDGCKEQGTKPLGSRRAEFMRPTGLLMLDFDHVGSPLSSPSPSVTWSAKGCISTWRMTPQMSNLNHSSRSRRPPPTSPSMGRGYGVH